MNDSPAVPENPFNIPRAEGVTATFLSRALQLVIGQHEVVKDDAFIAIVPPPVLGASLADRPDHKADVLKGIGIPVDFASTIRALKPETVSDIIGAALTCEETEPGFVRQSLAFDDWAKTVSKHRLWKVVAHGNWHEGAWTKASAEPGLERAPVPDTNSSAAKCLVALLALIDELKLISPNEKLEQLGIDCLITDLPPQLKDEVLRTGMRYGLTDRSPLLPESVFGIVKNPALVQYVRPEYLWEKVVLFVATRQDLPSAETEEEQTKFEFRPESGESLSEVAGRVGQSLENVRGETQPPPDPVLDQAVEAAQSATPRDRNPDTREIFNADEAQSVAAPPSDAAEAPPEDRPSTVPVGEDDIKPDEAGNPEPDPEPKKRSQPPPKPEKGGSGSPIAFG